MTVNQEERIRKRIRELEQQNALNNEKIMELKRCLKETDPSHANNIPTKPVTAKDISKYLTLCDQLLELDSSARMQDKAVFYGILKMAKNLVIVSSAKKITFTNWIRKRQ